MRVTSSYTLSGQLLNVMIDSCISGESCEMIVSPIKHTKILNEVNICRYLMRLLGDYPSDPVEATKLDEQLEKTMKKK